MNKRILFLYSDAECKNDIIQCENVLKAVFRKFRKSVILSYRQLDLSPSMRECEAESVRKEISLCDSVIFNSNINTVLKETEFARKCLGVFAKEDILGKRYIFSPVSKIKTETSDDCITQHSTISLQNISKTVSLASERAKERTHSILLCTDSRTDIDKLLFKEFEHALGNEPSVYPEYKSFDDLAWECTFKIPVFDVLLLPEDKARIVSLHVGALMRTPVGTVVWHTTGGRIYKRKIFPKEDMSSFGMASLLLTCASAFINEFEEKSIGEWLRRCVALSLEKGAYSNRKDFLDEVLRQINMPIRNRQVNKNDSNN